MDEIRVGEYIRTNGGNIYQIRKIEKSISAIGRTAYWVKEFYLLKEDIKSHSKNIIDLIETGDYVNGHLVLEKYQRPYDGQWQLECGDVRYEDSDIKIILTREMYEQNCYKVGVENE